jgi:hypothetical protein
MVSREGSHERGRYLLHTGYVPTGTVVHPSMGSISGDGARQQEARPAQLHLAGRLDRTAPASCPPSSTRSRSTRAAPGGGGGKGPAARAATDQDQQRLLPDGVDKNRFRERMKFLQEQEADFEKEHASEEVTRHKTAYEKADRLMHTPLLEAFDLGKEKPELVKSYGEGKFGRSCILRRRPRRARRRVHRDQPRAAGTPTRTTSTRSRPTASSSTRAWAP